MSYARILETGTSIYSDGKNMNFNFVQVPEDDVNIFLAELYTKHKKEFKQRVRIGKKLLKQRKAEVRGYFEHNNI